MSDPADIVTSSRLRLLFPKIRGDLLEAILTDVSTEFPKAGLTDPVRIAHFLSQIGAESGGFTKLEENLNYTTAARIAKVFGKKLFPTVDSAKPYVRNPMKLANYVYANKIGNGNEASGDGWAYRGSGLMQLTGRGNFRTMDKMLGTKLEQDPDSARHPDTALATALAYWISRKISNVATGTTDADVKKVTKLVNTALVGLDERQAYFKKALKIFSAAAATPAIAPKMAARAAPMAMAAAAPKGAAAAPVVLAQPDLSGAQWVARFPTSRALTDLVSPFRESATAFIEALRAAGAQVIVSATYRPPERAYLMHWAWQIAKLRFDPGKVPPMPGVAIIWAHPTSAKSVAAAKQMVAGFGMAFTAALNSRHTEGMAVDMTLSWKNDLKIKERTGGTRTIATQPRNGGNAELIKIGAAYGCIKLPTDPPHWSADGR